MKVIIFNKGNLYSQTLCYGKVMLFFFRQLIVSLVRLTQNLITSPVLTSLTGGSRHVTWKRFSMYFTVLGYISDGSLLPQQMIMGLATLMGAPPLVGYWYVPSHIAFNVVHLMSAVVYSSIRMN